MLKCKVPVAFFLVFAQASMAGVWASSAFAQEVPGCGSIENAYGPFDYRDPVAKSEKLHIVEIHHYTASVANLTKGITGMVIDELDYTLRAFPNHHPALQSVSRFALEGGKFRSEVIPSADCYFRRAITFQPDDQMVRILYGNYLIRSGQPNEAREQYETALRIAPESPEINYNAGLFYLRMNDIETARRLADKAYAAGYPLPGLRKKLEEATANTKTR